VPVFDYHRHCPRCLYDLCLDCCRDIRHSRANVARGECIEGRIEDRSKDSFSKRARLELSAESLHDKSFSRPIDLNHIDVRSLFPTWKVSNDGSITCGPHEAGGCGSSKMVLRRIFKINWIAKLVKCSEEMVNSCKVHDLEDGCGDDNTLELTGQQDLAHSKCSNIDGIDGNRLYSPLLEDLKYVGISHFRQHWVKREPIIIRNAFEPSLSSSWDPLSIWRGIQEIMDEKIDEDVKVKAVDFSNQSEVRNGYMSASCSVVGLNGSCFLTSEIFVTSTLRVPSAMILIILLLLVCSYLILLL
jgi:[histone H3]-dimethyl-L-lysine9 demethylase